MNASNGSIISGPCLERMLGYQPPYLMLDRAQVGSGDDGQRLTALRNISANEPYFAGHFPEYPILPGVLQLEALCQLGIIGARHYEYTKPGVPYICGAERIKFRRPVRPGDQMTVDVEISEDGDTVVVDGTTQVAGETTCQGRLRIGFLDPTTIQPQSLIVTTQRSPAANLSPNEDQDINAINRILPHRYPFLLVDRILDRQVNDDGTGSLIAIKNVTRDSSMMMSEDGHALFPNPLVLEMMAQSGCLLWLSLEQNKGKLAFFMSVDQAQFKRAPIPGDQLRAEARLLSARERFGKGCCDVYVGDELLGQAEIKFALI